MAKWIVRVVILLLVAGLALACSRPIPPTVKLERVAVTQISLAGVALLQTLTVTNPNAIGFTVRSVQVKVRADGRYDLGPVVVPRVVELPSRQPVSLDVPILFAWADISSLAKLAQANRDIDYDVDGSVAVGTESVSFNLPVGWHGVLRRDDLIRAGLNGLPGLLPGLVKPPRP